MNGNGNGNGSHEPCGQSGLWITGLGHQYLAYLCGPERLEELATRFYDVERPGLKKLLQVNRASGIDQRPCVQDMDSSSAFLHRPEMPSITDLNAVWHKALKKVPIDFFKEKPVKDSHSSAGALVYQIRRTLHDYADADALNMLRLIAKAMAPDSRLLIVELAMTNPPTPLAAAVDLFMFITAGKERTIEMFERLTADAGLRITRVVPGKTSGMGVLECMKV
ncbi:S-adenosyl-L-methionine-dependent methyltransferase [Cryphonectria parasitica EP155]|uniref:S-adenosyl-L-methionine-dependent methyltransferase n=1 Tax=Cryphonectria parasitica (strain ATCC 38755 / EP155) TaxID=660469 RepID=A0A9P4XWY0_CRYP1|nr:S-adenosyl-L-methionine-dependent methyltransferase [Cryphonectria parasitica EP155]KAF3762847.1 S-adenosyl-L-methionine-dependent methyltransferase [Cryphonectria parasitica EP155]